MKRRLLTAVGALLLGALVAGGLYKSYPIQAARYVGLARSYVLSWSAPRGTTTTEANSAYANSGPETFVPAPPPDAAAASWPSYNRTLTSERYSELDQINTGNVGKLKVLCSYDTNQFTSFETGLIMVNGALIGTTEFDIFSLDPATCDERWRTHEDYPGTIGAVNRGAAYMEGLLFRGTEDGRVLAYDFKTGVRIWETTIADPKKGESVPAAPIAWNGLVFIGNAGGDFKGGKGRMYALDAKTGKVVWEFYLVPRSDGDPIRGPLGKTPLDAATWQVPEGSPITGGGTWSSASLDPTTGRLYVPGGNPAPDFAIAVREGENLYTDSVIVLDAGTGAYVNHFKLVPKDWHDWDTSNAPALIRTRGGRKLMAAAPKDGYLYGFDLGDNSLLYRVPVTTIENADAPFAVGKAVHFCPGALGGAEWNGAAYDPRTNLLIVGAVDWCTTVALQPTEHVLAAAPGQLWNGQLSFNPFSALGRQSRADGEWAGWLHAVDADTGIWKWRLKSNYPIVGAVTPTAGGLVFFGDVGGNFYALDAATGEKLWGRKIGGGIGGGIITYAVNGVQRVAAATGFTSFIWPVEVTTGKIVVLGLESEAVR